MTAPARVGGPSPHDRSKAKQADGDKARRRSAAADRAYARRAQRAQNLRSSSPAPQQNQKQASKAPFVVLVMLVLVAGIAGIMYFSTQAAADSYRLQEARAEQEKLTLRVEQLRREVALLESPTDLARRATEMGLVQPSNPARLRQLPDGTIEEFGKPSAPTKSTPPPPPSTTTPPAGEQQPPAGTTPPAGEQAAGNEAANPNPTPPAGG